MAGIDLSGLNEGQREVVERLDEPLFVSAGAGSGKTHTLTARLVHALSLGSTADGGRYLDSIDQALVITFTDAAALEIKERVRQTLREVGENDPYLREQSLRVDGAWISTIHGMCSRILHRYALEMGIDPKFEVCDGSVADALLARALDEVMAEVQRDEAYATLRAEYPLWNSSAGSVVGMIDVLRSEASKSPDGFASFMCPQSHEAEGEVLALMRVFESIASLNITAKQREVTEASLAPLAAFAALPPGERTAARACEALADIKPPDLRKADQKPFKEDAKRQLARTVLCAQYERVQELCPQIVELARRVDDRYRELKFERSYLDNNDLISCALEAVENYPEVKHAFEGRFRLVMIDEFQDTDERQLRLISLLSGEGARHLTTVGDAQQSIYRFRGGDVAVFNARGAQLPDSQRVAMDVNYRSDHNVLALVERVCGDAGLLSDFLKLAGNEGRKSKYLTKSTGGYRPPRIRLEVAAGGNAELMSATLAAQIADRLAAYRDAGQPVGSMALLLGTTSRVGLYLDALRARNLPAVVTGGSSFSSTPEVGVVQALLHTLANPHDTETGLFRLLSSDMFRLDADDFCQLGTRKQDVLDAPTKRPFEQCFLTGELELYGGARPSERLALAHSVLVRAFGRIGRWQLADICHAVIEESGWLHRLEHKGINGLATAANVLAAVRHVRELTTSLGLGAARAADEFDCWLEAAKITPANLVGDEVDAVRVMTVHGSKGLQFAVTAVSECWGNPNKTGRLSVGKVDGVRPVCLAPGPAAGSLSAQRKLVTFPSDYESCDSVAEQAYCLDHQEELEEQKEKARLLYVALTRAEEALVVGLPVSDSEHYLSDLASGMLGAFPELDCLQPGEHAIRVAPETPVDLERREQDEEGNVRYLRIPQTADEGVARVIQLVRPKRGSGDPWQAVSAGSLEGFDGVLPESVTQIPLLGSGMQEGHVQRDRFKIYPIEEHDYPTSGWRAREGVFSYSSAHALMQERAESVESDSGVASFVSGSVDEAERVQKVLDARKAKGRKPPTPPRAQQEAEAEGSPYTDDADKATNLGSAFHELAQTMVETGRNHSSVRLEALARTWNLSQRAKLRLQQAVARWEGCALRREALSYELVRPEVPFFVQADSVYGQYVEGAIDLLACDKEATSALVVDYKTGDIGLSPDQIEQRHRMQANFYAWVLMEQGFERVECAFACVEVDDGRGGPVVVRYGFDQQSLPVIA